MTKGKLVIISTHADDDPERATIPFVMANAAIASEAEACVILQSTAVMLAMKGYTKHVFASAFPQLDELMKTFLEQGGKLLVCSPCLKARGLQEDELIAGARIIAAGTVIAETLSSDATLCY